MFEKLNKLVDTAQKIRTQLQQEGERAIKEALVDFFNAHPEVEAIRWSQYTPYFMDGDPCIFSVNEPSVHFNDASMVREHVGERSLHKSTWNSETRQFEDQGAYSDEELLTECGERGDGWYASYELDDKSEVGNQIHQLYNGLVALEPVLQDVFGDHIQVTCTREGITTEEYEHD